MDYVLHGLNTSNVFKSICCDIAKLCSVQTKSKELRVQAKLHCKPNLICFAKAVMVINHKHHPSRDDYDVFSRILCIRVMGSA